MLTGNYLEYARSRVSVKAALAKENSIELLLPKKTELLHLIVIKTNKGIWGCGCDAKYGNCCAFCFLPWAALMMMKQFRGTAVTLWHWAEWKLKSGYLETLLHDLWRWWWYLKKQTIAAEKRGLAAFKRFVLVHASHSLIPSSFPSLFGTIILIIWPQKQDDRKPQ